MYIPPLISIFSVLDFEGAIKVLRLSFDQKNRSIRMTRQGKSGSVILDGHVPRH
jgi:hypothetical protein